MPEVEELLRGLIPHVEPWFAVSTQAQIRPINYISREASGNPTTIPQRLHDLRNVSNLIQVLQPYRLHFAGVTNGNNLNLI
jgi:hypothetical protein